MRRAATLMAALAVAISATAATVRTATEAFVTNALAAHTSDTNNPHGVTAAQLGALTQEADPTVPAWAKAETPPASMTTNAVRDIVTNETGGVSYQCTGDLAARGVSVVKIEGPDDYGNYLLYLTDGRGVQSFGGLEVEPDVITFYVWGIGTFPEDVENVDFRRIVTPVRNALGLARLADLPPLLSVATNYTDTAIREQSLGGIWDEALNVWWTPRMRNGSLTYEATTNVNLNAEN